MEAKLVVVGGKANKAEVQLKLPTVIGRGRDADLTVAHPTVSRHHCVLFEQDGVLFVRDNGSLNGTLVEGNKVEEAQLKPGETLTVGPLTFRAEYQWSAGLPGGADAPAVDEFAELDSAVPGSNSAASGSNSAVPGSNSAVPGSNSAVPGSNSAVPGSNSAVPGSNKAVPRSNGAPSDATIPFDDVAAIKSSGGAAADSAPSLDFLASEPSVEADLAPAESLLADSSLDLGPPARMDDDELSDFLDDKSDLPPTANTRSADAMREREPAASAEPEEFALAAIEKKPSVMDDEVLALLGGDDDEPPARRAEGVQKIGDDGKPATAAAQPAPGDDELNDFLQSLGVK